MLKRFFCLLILVMGLITLSHAQQQTREDLQNKETDIRKEIAELNNMLQQTQKSKKLSLNQLAIIKKKISQRLDLVNTINKQVHQLDETIFNNERDIEITAVDDLDEDDLDVDFEPPILYKSIKINPEIQLNTN